MTTIAGIDGCRGGWICVVRNLRTGELSGRILPRIGEIGRLVPRPGLVMIDIPIGLPPSGSRRCELEARKLLGRPRSSSVFPAPIRPCLDAATYEEACAIRKMSRQTWGILPKIREVDLFLRQKPAWRGRLREVHPELAFCLWSSGHAMRHAKKTPEGRAERERLVRAHFGGAYQRLVQGLERGPYGRDDLLDAMAALRTAERVHSGEALVLPAAPEVDPLGLAMEIVA